MRRLQMGYVWELRNLIESGRFDIDSRSSSANTKTGCNFVCFRYEKKDFTVVIQPAFTDVRSKDTKKFFLVLHLI